MNKQENTNKLKEAFKKALAFAKAEEVKVEEVKEQKFADVPLKDGTVAQVDKLEKDGIVTLADGSIALAGELPLADGSILVIGENGVIVEIKPATDETPVEEAQVEQAAAPAAEAEVPAEQAVEDTTVADLTARIVKLEEAVTALLTQNTEMSKQVAEFTSQPAGEAVVTEKKFATQKVLTLDEQRVERVKNMINSLPRE